MACLVQVTKKEWPECRSLSGAVQKYLPDALNLRQQQERREASKRAAEQARQESRQTQATRQTEERQLHEAWNALPPEEREAIVQQVRARLAGTSAPDTFVHRLCLEELGRRLNLTMPAASYNERLE
jgi:hypothetical protein